MTPEVASFSVLTYYIFPPFRFIHHPITQRGIGNTLIFKITTKLFVLCTVATAATSGYSCISSTCPTFGCYITAKQ